MKRYKSVFKETISLSKIKKGSKIEFMSPGNIKDIRTGVVKDIKFTTNEQFFITKDDKTKKMSNVESKYLSKVIKY